MADAGEEEIELILRRQDDALELLGRLREIEPIITTSSQPKRDIHRWRSSAAIKVEFHDGHQWHLVECSDIGVGGARLRSLPTWAEGPCPVRLSNVTSPGVLALSDVMWKNEDNGCTGIHFEFLDQEERDTWTNCLIDGLLDGAATR